MIDREIALLEGLPPIHPFSLNRSILNKRAKPPAQPLYLDLDIEPFACPDLYLVLQPQARRQAEDRQQADGGDRIIDYYKKKAK